MCRRASVDQPTCSPTPLENALLYGLYSVNQTILRHTKQSANHSLFQPNQGIEKQLNLLRDVISHNPNTISNLLSNEQEHLTLNTAAKAAAYSRNRNLTHAFIAKGADIIAALFGSSLAKDFEHTDEILEKQAKNPHLNTLLSAAAAGAAIAKEYKKVMHYQKLGASIAAIAFGYGISRDEQAGNQLLIENIPHRTNLLNQLLIGAGIGAHRLFAFRLIEQGANIYALLYGAAIRNDKIQMAELLEKPGMRDKQQLIGLVLGGHIAQAEALRKHKEAEADAHNPELNLALSQAAFFAGYESYACFLQGNNISITPSNTPRYAALTASLPQTFFCEFNSNFHLSNSSESDFHLSDEVENTPPAHDTESIFT